MRGCLILEGVLPVCDHGNPVTTNRKRTVLCMYIHVPTPATARPRCSGGKTRFSAWDHRSCLPVSPSSHLPVRCLHAISSLVLKVVVFPLFLVARKGRICVNFEVRNSCFYIYLGISEVNAAREARKSLVCFVKRGVQVRRLSDCRGWGVVEGWGSTWIAVFSTSLQEK